MPRNPNFRRPDEHQIVDVQVFWPYAMLGFVQILTAVTIFGIQWQFNNDHFDVADQACPAPDIFSFVTTSRNLFLLSGLLDLAICGFISLFYSSLNRVEEAVFFGHVFMGLFGEIIRFAVDFYTVAYSLSSMIKLIKANGNVSSIFDGMKPESYCSSRIWSTAVAASILLVIFTAGQLFFLLAPHFRKLKPLAQEETIELRGVKKDKKSRFNPKKLEWGGFQPNYDLLDDILDEDMREGESGEEEEEEEPVEEEEGEEPVEEEEGEEPVEEEEGEEPVEEEEGEDPVEEEEREESVEEEEEEEPV